MLHGCGIRHDAIGDVIQPPLINPKHIIGIPAQFRLFCRIAIKRKGDRPCRGEIEDLGLIAPLIS
ncbi:hypothetical protein Hgul01_05424 [Herpetosiphon gulosus]|uniref:Uncharacterized protein n=1 Tax=Herpetosiphon gulosus TaxID=1973496 RepID=A0ABP9X882_9CHLR